MNKVILIGRLVKDPDIRTGTNNITIARYTLAVERQYRKDNEWKADFINDCLVETHEFVESKGRSNQSESIGTVPPPAPASDTFVEPAYDPDLPFS